MANSNAPKPITLRVGTSPTGSTNQVLEYVEPVAINGESFQSLGVGCLPPSSEGAINATGDITAFFSDDRLKTKLGALENALDKVCSLEGFLYIPNERAVDLGYVPAQHVGLSAQSVRDILPEAVAPAPIAPEYLTIKYDRLIPLLVEAIKELKQQVDDLKHGSNQS